MPVATYSGLWATGANSPHQSCALVTGQKFIM
jgi:hypothetical protein